MGIRDDIVTQWDPVTSNYSRQTGTNNANENLRITKSIAEQKEGQVATCEKFRGIWEGKERQAQTVQWEVISSGQGGTSFRLHIRMGEVEAGEMLETAHSKKLC